VVNVDHLLNTMIVAVAGTAVYAKTEVTRICARVGVIFPLIVQDVRVAGSVVDAQTKIESNCLERI
jgi:hypothetical protein